MVQAFLWAALILCGVGLLLSAALLGWALCYAQSMENKKAR